MSVNDHLLKKSMLFPKNPHARNKSVAGRQRDIFLSSRAVVGAIVLQCHFVASSDFVIWGAVCLKAQCKMALTLHFFPSCRRREERGTLASQPIRACLLAIAKLLTPESSKAASASSAFNLPRIFLRFLPNAHRSLRSHREQPPIREESMTFYLPNIVKMLEDPCAAWRLLFLGTQVSSLYCYNSFSRTGFFFASADGKFVILNIYVITSLNEPPAKKDFHCVSSNKTNLCIFL